MFGIDFHRRRSVIVRMNRAGERLSAVRVANEPALIAEAVTAAGAEPEVVIEATYGWYWIVDLLQELGRRCIWPARRHLVATAPANRCPGAAGVRTADPGALSAAAGAALEMGG